MYPILLLAIIPPLIWAAINHLDKFSIERYMQGRNPGALVIFTGIAAFLVATLIFFFRLVHRIPESFAFATFFGGAILAVSYVPYVYALRHDEASNVAPLFQLVTPYVYVLGLIFLGERLPFLKLCAGSLIFIGAIVLTFDFKKTRIRSRTFLLMTFASLMIAGNVIIFKSFALKTDFWTTAFYDSLGAAFGGLALLLVPVYRRDFLGAVRQFTYRVVGLNMFTETLNILARFLYGFVTLAVPAILVQFMTGLQPLFILLIGIGLTKWAPRFGVEAVDRHNLVRKFSAILLMVVGLVLLSVYT